MYTYEERQNILNELINFFKNRDDISAVILVGSGSYGFKDNYSDIDIALVYDEKYPRESVFQKTVDYINCNHNIAVYLNQIGRNLQVILLDNYLELDIGYYSIDTLCARRKEYKVIYDKTNSVDAIMERSWEENKDKNMGTTSNVDMGNELFKTDANLWYNTIHTVNAFNRGEKYRCFFELGELRNNIISLVGKRSNIETKRFRSVHCLSNEQKTKIDALFLYPENAEQLRDILCFMLEIFYEEFTFWKFSPRVEKEFIKKYVTENL